MISIINKSNIIEKYLNKLGRKVTFFDNGNEADVIENQEKLGKTLELDGDKIARIRTIYDDRESFTDYCEITDRNVSEYAIINPEKQIPVSDGLIVSSSDVGILLPLADCLGIAVFDEEHQGHYAYLLP